MKNLAPQDVHRSEHAFGESDVAAILYLLTGEETLKSTEYGRLDSQSIGPLAAEAISTDPTAAIRRSCTDAAARASENSCATD
jgi:hypothetical protein